jgi:hypothetical protein
MKPMSRIAQISGIISSIMIAWSPWLAWGANTADPALPHDGRDSSAVPHRANNAELKELPAGVYSRVYRDGFRNADDGGSAFYSWSSSPCLAADDGAQVTPSLGSGCWIADFSDIQPTPKIWGATGDGVTDDTAAIRAAVSALQGTGRSLYVGPYVYGYSGPISITKTLRVTGENYGYRYAAPGKSGFVPKAKNLTLFDIRGATASGSVLEKFAIAANSAGTNTTGAIVKISDGGAGQPHDLIVRELLAWGPCIGIDETTGNENLIESNGFYAIVGNGCGGIRVGRSTIAGGTVGTRILNNKITGNSGFAGTGEYGVLLLDSGGAYQAGNDILYTQYGTEIKPGASQSVIWSFFTGTVYGDTNQKQALLVDPQAASAVVTGLQFTGSWGSNSQGTAVWVRNQAGATINGIHFTGHRALQPNANIGNMQFDAGTNITIDNSQICPAAGGNVPVIGIGSTVTNIAIRNCRIGLCDQASFSATVANGVSIATGANRLIITGNDFTGVTTPIGWAGGAYQAIITNNLGLDDTNGPTQIAAPTINLPINPVIPISGTKTITTINRFWLTRAATLVPISAGVNFRTGGNICNALSPAQMVMVMATYIAGPNCWSLK